MKYHHILQYMKQQKILTKPVKFLMQFRPKERIFKFSI